MGAFPIFGNAMSRIFGFLRFRRQLGCSIGVLAIAFVTGLQAEERGFTIDELAQGVVQIHTESGSGSGSIFDRDGVPMVVTNRHVVAGYDRAVVAIMEDPNEPARPAYRAEIEAFSGEFDLALLRITEDLDGKAVRSVDDIAVPPLLSRASSASELARGDEIAILGYPGIGNDELVYTPGTVSSVRYDEFRGTRMPFWYRTDAEMSSGNSGGVAISEDGDVIGLPTSVAMESRTGGRLGNILAIGLVHAVLEQGELHASWSDYTPLDASADPHFGESMLAPGFTPDPHMVEIVSGGQVDVSDLGSECIGYAAREPDYRLHWTETGEELFISFRADDPDDDATMVVRTPNNEWLCNDDAHAGTLDPELAIQDPPAGDYAIWIGTYVPDTSFVGELEISEIHGLRSDSGDAARAGSGLDWSLDPHFGTEHLSTGFLPDPHTVAVTAGGSVDVTAQRLGADCIGHASQAPDFRLHWAGDARRLGFYFKADSRGDDTTLIVSLPDGQWRCNDDAHSSTLNPAVTIEQPDRGQYDVWVGTYFDGDFIDGELGITELRFPSE